MIDKNLAGSAEDLFDGLIWALDPTRSVDVLNTSVAVPGIEGTGEEAREKYFDRKITEEPHVVWAQAAGNTGLDANPANRTVRVPGGAWNVLTVSAFDDKNTTDETQHAWMPESSFGPTWTRKKPDICAPGVSIDAPFTIGPNDHAYLARTGTSLATPHVTGVAALVRSAPFPPVGKPNVDEGFFVKAIIINAATPPPTRALGPGAKLGQVAPGNWDGQWGWGKLNAERAVSIAQNAFTHVDYGVLSQNRPAVQANCPTRAGRRYRVRHALL